MNIYVTEYTRDDRTQALRTKDDAWIVRRTDGVCCFYRPGENKEWVPAHSINDAQLDAYKMDLDAALNLLATLPRVR